MNETFKPGEIKGVILKEIKQHQDDRGWLGEIFRKDELSPEIFPEMAYVSLTKPGVKRGPHEHALQTDYFAFLGPSNFLVELWDNRKDSRTFLNKMVLDLGQDRPSILVVPPGVVHAYRNTGGKDGLVFNAANKLYGGWNKKGKVDEIRHENDVNGVFI